MRRRAMVVGFFAAVTIMAASVAYDLFQMPVQASDSLLDILYAHSSDSLFSAFTDGRRTHFRPLRDTQIKALLDLSAGHYHLVYRGFHSALVLLASWLFVRCLRVTSATDMAAALLAFTVFMGLHTLTGAVVSIFPINHFLEVVVLALLALHIAQRPPTRWSGVALVAVSIVATLVLESGLLLCAVTAAAWWAGFPGATTRRAVVIMVCALAYVSFSLSSGYTTVIPDVTGFGFERLESEAAARMLAEHRLAFHTYNVASSLSMLLFAEPRYGVFVAIRDWTQGALSPRVVIPIISSTLTSLLIAVTAWRLRGTYTSTHGGRLLCVVAVVLLANAAMSFAYTKDEIMSVAGAFYAIAAYVAFREMLTSLDSGRRVRRLVVAFALAVVSAGWAVRVESLHYATYVKTFKDRNDWADPALLRSSDPGERALTLAIRAEVIADRWHPNPRFVPDWVPRWLEEGP